MRQDRRKSVPSAFFRTGLNDMLLHEKCDSTMIWGLTTSGCVCATIVDGLQYNYPTWVTEDACGRRLKKKNTMAKTLYDKLWENHFVTDVDGDGLLYIDRHLIHEVTSPQAFDGLAQHGRKVRPPDLTIARMDHSISTQLTSLDACGPKNALQLRTLIKNCQAHGIVLYPVGDDNQGIVHVMRPEMGLIHPGMTVVCGDSHTATHGALGTLAFGIGTSDVEHVLATQTIRQSKAKNMKVELFGDTPAGITAKDLILAMIGQIGSAGATGCVIEYNGEPVRSLSMEGRTTMCNMSVEAGAKAGMITPDETTFAYLHSRPFAPAGEK